VGGRGEQGGCLVDVTPGGGRTTGEPGGQAGEGVAEALMYVKWPVQSAAWMSRKSCRAVYRLRQRMMSRLVRTSAVRLATQSCVDAAPGHGDAEEGGVGLPVAPSVESSAPSLARGHLDRAGTARAAKAAYRTVRWFVYVINS
jgi:hypothetical protein